MDYQKKIKKEEIFKNDMILIKKFKESKEQNKKTVNYKK